jgi:AcrR family transcriptional regulator
LAEMTDPHAGYFAAAMEILADDGYAGLKLAPLCKRLGVTSGAFYHNFGSWQDFTNQLLEHWHAEKTTSLVELARAQADAQDQLETLIEVTCQLPHRAEAAIRVWSRLDARVKKLQDEVDEERAAIVREAFRPLVGDDEAALYAQAGMYLLIGFEQSQGTAGLPTADLAALEWSLRSLLRSATQRPADHVPVAERRHHR